MIEMTINNNHDSLTLLVPSKNKKHRCKRKNKKYKRKLKLRYKKMIKLKGKNA